MYSIVWNGENDPRACKEILGRVIPDMAEKDPEIVYLDADLMSCIGTLKWGVTSDRAIECGIAEANMIGVAAGLAAQGFKPICHSFAPFASRRSFDQIFLSAGYAKNDITIIGSDPGVTATMNGGTHMPFEDTGIYRTLPGATILDVSDPTQLESVLRQCPDRKGVKYIRVGRKTYQKIYAEGSEIPIGKAITLKEGKDIVLFASGIMTGEAMRAAQVLAEQGIDAAVVDCFTVKPLDEEAIIKYARQCGAAVIAENHNRYGGLFSAISETLACGCPIPAGVVAVEDEFGEVGPQGYLQKRFGLTPEHIVEEALAVLKRKNA